VDEADRAEVSHTFGPLFLRDECDICLVEQIKVAATQTVERVDRRYYITLMMGQHSLKKRPVKPSGLGALSDGS
jgi:hypothetical protein